MSETEELPPIIATEQDTGNTSETIQPTRQSIKSEKLSENLEANKTPNPSVKSGQEIENVEAQIRSSIKSGQGVEQIEEGIRSSITSGQGAESIEVKKTPKSSVVEKNTPKSSVVESVPLKPEPEKIPPEDVPEKKLEDIFNKQKASEEVTDSLERPQIPKASRETKVDLTEDSKPTKRSITEWPFKEGGFISNEGVKQPSLKENTTILGDLQNAPNRSANCQAQPWLYAVLGLLLLTIIMRFFMSNFKLLCVTLYSVLVSMLALRHYGHGPFAGRRRFRH